MQQFKYLGTTYHKACEMCGESKAKQIMYKKYPHPAIKDLVDTGPMTICKKCTQREMGSKRKKELNELEKNS